MKNILVICLSFALTLSVHAGSATWSTNPTSGDWFTAANWNPATVPNAATDIATFATSDVTQVSQSSNVTVDSIVFNPGADSFSLSATSTIVIFSGAGVVNNSGQTQNFIWNGTPQSPFQINFENSSSAGEATNYTLNGGGAMYFTGKSTAGSANVTAESDYDRQDIFYFAFVDFNGTTPTAGNATFNILHHGVASFDGGTAANAIFNIVGGNLNFNFGSDAGESVIDVSEGGQVEFEPESKSPGTFHVTAQGANGRKGVPGLIVMRSEHPSAGTFVVEGGMGQQSHGGIMILDYSGTLSNGNVTVMGGKSGGLGGTLALRGCSNGGMARISLSGNAMLDFSRHDRGGTIDVGSVEGKGTIVLGAIPVRIGNNNLSTTFSGVIQDGDARPVIGPLDKIGTGILILSGANTYTAGTTVEGGSLSVTNLSGSATGTGPVTVSTGSLGGTGIIGGAVTIDSGAFLQPSVGLAQPASLTLQSTLTFASGSTYSYRLNNKKKQGDSVTANGVAISSGAQFNLVSVAQQKLPTGLTFVVINNVAASAISGTFANLADGATIDAGANQLQANYEGGDGNDLTLTVQ